MKRITFIMLGLFTIFTFNSCEKKANQVDDDCKQYYHYTCDVTIEIMALEDGQPMAEQLYQYKVVTYRCNMSPINSSYDGFLDENGYRKSPLTHTFNFFNNHDYVEITVFVFGNKQEYLRTIDYRDFNGVDFREIAIEAVFNF